MSAVDIAEAMRTTAGPQRGRKCIVVKHLDSIPLDTPNRDDLVAAVEDTENWRAERLALTFINLGMDVSPSAIRNHRRVGGCCCDRPAS